MRVTIKYFGVVAEETGKTEEVLDVESGTTDIASLKKICFSKYPITDPSSIRIAVNQNLGASGELKDGDEIAFLPPFSGG